jgi:hypothetical protein
MSDPQPLSEQNLGGGIAIDAPIPSSVTTYTVKRRMKFFNVTKREMLDISEHNADASNSFALCTAFAGTGIGILSNFANTQVKDMSVMGCGFLFVGVPILLLLATIYGFRARKQAQKKNSIIATIESEASEASGEQN